MPFFTIFIFVGRLLDEDETGVPDKGKVQYEHMKRVRAQMAAEEEALKRARIIRGLEAEKEKKRLKKLRKQQREDIPDEKKLEIMRTYQLLIGLIGLIGVGIIIWGIKIPLLRLLIHGISIEIDMIFLGSLMAIGCVVGIIGFQHKHDRISDRMIAKERMELGIKKRRY